MFSQYLLKHPLHTCFLQALLGTCPSYVLSCLYLLDGDHNPGSQEPSYVGKRSNRVVRTLQNSKWKM